MKSDNLQPIPSIETQEEAKTLKITIEDSKTGKVLDVLVADVLILGVQSFGQSHDFDVQPTLGKVSAVFNGTADAVANMYQEIGKGIAAAVSAVPVPGGKES